MDRRLKTAAVLLSVLFVFAGLAQAQIWGRGNNNDRERSYQAGYRDGMQHGRADAARGIRYSPRTDNRGGGFWGAARDRNAYRDGYRNGYDVGYRERARNGNYGNYGGGPWGNPRNTGGWGVPGGVYNGGYGGYGNVAGQARDYGYRDGLGKGQNDARQGKSFDPNRHDAYKDADNGYHSNYGSKSAYQQAYRNAFMQGYQQGYRGSGYGNYGGYGTYGGYGRR